MQRSQKNEKVKTGSLIHFFKYLPNTSLSTGNSTAIQTLTSSTQAGISKGSNMNTAGAPRAVQPGEQATYKLNLAVSSLFPFFPLLVYRKEGVNGCFV